MKILVAIDGSPSSVDALQKAVRLFGKDHAWMIANAHPDGHLRRHQNVVGKSTVDGYIEEVQVEDLRDAQSWLATEGIAHRVVKAQGEPAPTLANLAKSNEVDMIVMGSKGRGSITEMLVGSVVNKLIALSSVPVFVVK